MTAQGARRKLRPGGASFSDSRGAGPDAVSKTESVRSRVFEAIVRGEYRPGQIIPPERDMAAITDTSRVTVRRAYAELEDAGILERRQGSGARICTAGHGHARRADVVAVLASLKDAFALDFIEAMERALAGRSAFLLLKLTDQNAALERRAAVDLAQHGVRDFVVWASGGGYDRELFARLRILGTNQVFFDRMIPGNFADYVGLDNSHAIEMLVSRAAERGATRCLMLSHRGLGADSDRQREDAFGRCCLKRGLAAKIVRAPTGTREPLSALGEAEEWLESPGRLAVVGVNDDLARRVKRSRPDLAVYGIDGLPETVAEGIVSVRHPMADMARAAVRMLLDQQRLGRRWRARTRIFKGMLVGCC